MSVVRRLDALFYLFCVVAGCAQIVGIPGDASSSNDVRACDGQGECGDADMGCVECAMIGKCREHLAACESNADCAALVDALHQCSAEDDVCVTNATDAHPEGFSLYDSMAKCIICGECPLDCGGKGAGCP